MNTNFNTGDYVLLLERHNMTRSSNDDYVFEGICAKFGIANENMREYSKSDYLPHLEYLNQKIAKRSLLGELDHPKDYEVSLQNASHIVEKLWYEESDDSVRIRIRLLNGTPNGDLAKSLVDMGVPLSISSRAVGQIKESKQVKLHRIFTYDLVAEPGFSEAVLDRKLNESFSPMVGINEQFDEMKKDSLFTSHINDVNNQQNFADGIKIYKINDSDEILSKFKLNESSENNNETMDNNYVKSDDFNDFSLVTKTEISSIKNTLGTINENLKTVIDATKPKKTNEAIEDIQAMQAQEVAQDTEAQDAQTQIQDVDAQTQGTQEAETTELENVSADDDDKTVISKLAAYVQYLSDQVKVVMDHSDIVTENLNKVINYSQNIGFAVNEHVNHTNGGFKTVNDAINYMQFVGQVVNRVDESQEKIIKYANEHTKVINEMILFSDYNSGLVGNIVEHTNYLANVLRGSSLADGKGTSAIERNLGANIESISESIVTDTGMVKTDTSNVVNETKGELITEKVDALLSSIEKDRVSNVLEARHPFLKLLTEDDKGKFYKLGNDMKTKVVATMEASVYFNREDVVNLMNSIILEENASLPNHLKFIPEKFKPIYSEMNESQKVQLDRAAKSGIYKLNSAYQVKFFWESQDFSGIKAQIHNDRLVEQKANNAQKNLNEDQSKEGFIKISDLNEAKRGYSSDYLDSIRNTGRKITN